MAVGLKTLYTTVLNIQQLKQSNCESNIKNITEKLKEKYNNFNITLTEHFIVLFVCCEISKVKSNLCKKMYNSLE